MQFLKVLSLSLDVAYIRFHLLLRQNIHIYTYTFPFIWKRKIYAEVLKLILFMKGLLLIIAVLNRFKRYKYLFFLPPFFRQSELFVLSLRFFSIHFCADLFYLHLFLYNQKYPLFSYIKIFDSVQLTVMHHYLCHNFKNLPSSYYRR